MKPSLPIISDLLVVAGMPMPGMAMPGMAMPGQLLSVGLVLDGQSVFWGDCLPAAAAPLPDEPGPLRPESGRISLETVVAPALVGRELAAFRPLAALLRSLTETVTVTRLLPAAPAEPGPPRLTRRQLLTGLVQPPAARQSPEQRVEQVTVTRPLSPALLYGLTQALLAAVAAGRQQTMGQVLAQEYGLPQVSQPVPLLASLPGAESPQTDLAIDRRLPALGYTIAADAPDAKWGDQAQALHQEVIALRVRLARRAASDYRPVIYLALGGGYGRLFDNRAGRILGAFVSLKHALDPLRGLVENAVLLDDLPAQVALLAQLRGYVRRRKLNLSLVEGVWARSPQALDALLEAEAVDSVHLNLARLGGLDVALEMAQTCRRHGVGVVLSGSPFESPLSTPVLAQAALALQPDFLQVPAASSLDAGTAWLHNEMARALAQPAPPPRGVP